MDTYLCRCRHGWIGVNKQLLLELRLSRISGMENTGMEQWNGTLEQNTGMTKLDSTDTA